MTDPQIAACRRFHPRRTFLWRYAVCVALTWAFASLIVWALGDAPAVIVALFPAPLWGTLGAIYVEDHYRRIARG